ncbi:MAG: hypothetical protein EOS42_32235 [Mesorhizobium sp.]|nr:MAG: hypothetical protein EOS42_32235 [Mesorhizobium sp.]TIV25285.1 MAG: hypothetical protein E5V90_28640 [Mesorhizobium sp.]
MMCPVSPKTVCMSCRQDWAKKRLGAAAEAANLPPHEGDARQAEGGAKERKTIEVVILGRSKERSDAAQTLGSMPRR